jgi:excinuclease ABC subunit A
MNHTKETKTTSKAALDQEYIEVIGARVHNLRDIDVRIPRNKLVVITGISGSGKSSLAFDTIYAEGQRRYMETFTAYARQFIGEMERPDVEQINGLSPVISIEQKTTSRNPRSTVGTTTEIYDFLRLLFARIGEAVSYESGKKMVKYTEEQMVDHIFQHFQGKKTLLLAPMVRGRKGHYRELFESIRKQGFTKVRVDGVVLDISPGMQIDRYKVHDIEVVVDRMTVESKRRSRLSKSIESALRIGNGFIMLLDTESGTLNSYSKQLMDPDSGISYEEPSPNSFSFNSPYGACPKCKGLGKIHRVDMDKVIPDDSKSINDVGIAPFGDVRDNTTFKQLRAIAKKVRFHFCHSREENPRECSECHSTWR